MPKFLYPTCIERPRRNRDSEFTKWQQPAMCYVALGWHAIVFARWQHPAMWHVTRSSGIMTMNSPCGSTLAAVRQVALWWHAIEFAQTSAIFFEFYIWFRFRPHITVTAVDMSFCTSLRNFIQIGPPSAEKNDVIVVMSIFQMADLSHLGF